MFLSFFNPFMKFSNLLIKYEINKKIFLKSTNNNMLQEHLSKKQCI
jgi:hypothetical protein